MPTKKTRMWFVALLICVGLQFVPFLFSYDVLELPEDLPLSARVAFEKAHDHLMPMIHARVFKRGVAILSLLVLLSSGLPGWMENRYGQTAWRWPARLLFFLLLFVWFRVTAYPYAYFSFLHDRAFELTTLTSVGWWTNVAKGLPVPMTLFLLRCVLLFCIMALCGRKWWWVAAVTLFLLFNVVPEKLSRQQPIDLVEKRQPLPEGDIRTEFEALAKQTGRHLELVMVDQSKRSRRVNMALTGRLGREYVLVTDTLLNLLSPDQARAMLAHELGHDVTRQFVVTVRWTLSFATMLLMVWIVYRWHGRKAIPESEIPAAIVQLLLVSQLVGYIAAPLNGTVNRFQERQADAYAVELTNNPEGLASLLLVLAETNLEPYDVPRWAFYLYGSTHPTVRERLEAVRGTEDRRR